MKDLTKKSLLKKYSNKLFRKNYLKSKKNWFKKTNKLDNYYLIYKFNINKKKIY